MFASGAWRGFWEQAHLGRQEMQQFELHFDAGRITGRGADVIGRFVMRGVYHEATGAVSLVKSYLGKHQVVYRGEPDGEGSFFGTWTVEATIAGRSYSDEGPFLMAPVHPGGGGDAPIQDVVPGS